MSSCDNQQCSSEIIIQRLHYSLIVLITPTLQNLNSWTVCQAQWEPNPFSFSADFSSPLSLSIPCKSRSCVLPGNCSVTPPKIKMGSLFLVYFTSGDYLHHSVPQSPFHLPVNLCFLATRGILYVDICCCCSQCSWLIFALHNVKLHSIWCNITILSARYLSK